MNVSDHSFVIIWVVKIFLYSSSVYSCQFLISSASVRSIPFLSFIEPIFEWNVSLVSLIFLKRSLVFPILLFSSISLHWSLREAFLSLLANSLELCLPRVKVLLLKHVTSRRSWRGVWEKDLKGWWKMILGNGSFISRGCVLHLLCYFSELTKRSKGQRASLKLADHSRFHWIAAHTPDSIN